MTTIAELAKIGKENYTRKIPGMHTSYAAAASRAQAGYDATPYAAQQEYWPDPERESSTPRCVGPNYRSAWTVMPGHYTTKVTAAVADKWVRVWSAISGWVIHSMRKDGRIGRGLWPA